MIYENSIAGQVDERALYKAALLAVERMRGCAATYIEDHARDSYPGQVGLRPQDVATMWADEIHAIDAKVYLDEAIADLASLTPTAPQAADRDVCAEMRALCSYCGGTGDVHSVDGEWRGRCTCPAGAPQAASQQAEPFAWMKPDEITGLLGHAKRSSENRHYGRIYAQQYDPDMVPVFAAPQAAATASTSADATPIDEGTSRAQAPSQSAPLEDAIFGVLHDCMGGDINRARLRDAAKKVAALARAPLPAQAELLTEIQAALDSLADTKMTTYTYISMANALHHCRDAITGRGYYGGGQAVDVARDAWQAIETAPQDKLLLLAYEFDRPGDWRIKVGGFWNGEWEVFGASWTPTRWMPMPEVPTVTDYAARRAAQSRTNATGGSKE